MKGERPPYGVAALCGLGVFALYALTLGPSTAWWDASEYIATAYTLGIPHPPGNPLFVVLARTWSILLAPLGLSVAVRINLFAAATSAGAASFFFLIANRTLRQTGASLMASRVGGCTSALLGATAYTVWSQSNANEKVYTLSVLIIALASWLVLRWRDVREEEGSQRLLLWAVYLMILGSTSHLMSLLPVAATGVFVLLTDPRTVFSAGFAGRVLLAGAVALSFNFFLPVRAAERPVINEGDSLCSGVVEAAKAIYTGGRAGCPALGASLTREQYRKPPLSQRMAPPGHQLANYFQYFDWQWARGLDPNEPTSPRRIPVTLLFVALGFMGLWMAFRGETDTGLYLTILFGTVTVGLVFYLNFRFGFSLAPEVLDRGAHEVRERDYFFLASFSLWGVLSGLGLAGVWNRLGVRLGNPRVAAPVLGLALIPLVFNWSWADRAGDYAARDWAYDLLTSVEPYGILFTNGDNDTFPLWYLQEVEGIRKDVTVAVVQYLYTDWYPKQLRELTSPDRQRPFVPVVPGLYQDPGLPSTSVLPVADEQVAQIGDGPVGADFSVQFGSVVVEFPEGMYLGRGHRVALAMMATVGNERPVYFAGTGGEMETLGLAPWGVQQGLVAKLMMRDLNGEQPAEYAQVSPSLGAEWVDLPRTLRLVDEVYQYRGISGRDVWPDPASFNVPSQFYFLTARIAELVAQSGDSARATHYAEMATDFLAVAQGGRKARRTY